MITIVAIGKKHEPWIEDGTKHYQNRLRRPFDAQWVLLPHSSQTDVSARQDESGRILSRLDNRDFVVLLDERGKEIDSPELAKQLDASFAAGRPAVFIIGGAYGVDDRVRERADLVWSLSPLIFPHQLVRLILIEQLYRSQQINVGHPYHHE